ncbi:hypothetical protein [Kibdelosporangium aridum]|uniref:hypothetical protein n=1 Tax=Kibdelosporangium aridum TaxID=2030 RepID=UPI0035E92F9D
MHDIGEQWEATVSGPVEVRLRELGGTLLGVTTAAHPHRITRFDQLVPLIMSGQIAMGWIALAGAEQPLTEMPMPEDLKTYVLHYSPNHATVGELLATTTPSLPPAQAQAWALDHIPLLGDHLPREGRLLDWQQVNLDPNAWYTFDVLSPRPLLRAPP